MLGYCPHCKVSLKEKTKNRETNEMILILKYRTFIDAGKTLLPFNEIGYCEICNLNKDKEEDK